MGAGLGVAYGIEDVLRRFNEEYQLQFDLNTQHPLLQVEGEEILIPNNRIILINDHIELPKNVPFGVAAAKQNNKQNKNLYEGDSNNLTRAEGDLLKVLVALIMMFELEDIQESNQNVCGTLLGYDRDRKFHGNEQVFLQILRSRSCTDVSDRSCRIDYQGKIKDNETGRSFANI